MIKESSHKFENKETFDFDEFLSYNQFTNIHLLERFIKDIFRELSNAKGGINLETFREFINMPSYIADKIFKVFDTGNNNCLNSKTFLDGMLRLYYGDFQTLTKFIFEFYDFDKDGNIIYEDVNQIQLLILPSQHHSDEVFKCIKESLDSFFEEYKLMSYDIFDEITENFNSDIFMNLLIYLYTNKPFSNEIINYYNSDKRVGEESNFTGNGMNRKDDCLKKYGLKKMHTECDQQGKRKSFSISKQYDPLFHSNQKDLPIYKSNEMSSDNDNVSVFTDHVRFGSSNSKNININDKNIKSNRHAVNVFNTNDDFNKYSKNFDNLESSSSYNLNSPKFADKKQNKISINYNSNDNNIYNNLNTQENSYANEIQKASQSNSNFALPISDSILANKHNLKKKKSQKNSKMKIKSPKNNLYLKGIRQNFSRMVTYSDAQNYEESQGIIKEETGDNCDENDPDYDEYEAFFEPPADERTEIYDIIVVPQMPSIRNLFEIFRKMLSKRYDDNDPDGKIRNKRSLTEDDVMMPKIKNKATIKLAEKLAIDINSSDNSLKPQDPSLKNCNNLVTSTNQTFYTNENSIGAVSGMTDKNFIQNNNNKNTTNNVIYNLNSNTNENNEVEVPRKLTKKKTCASEKVENAPTLNEEYINSYIIQNKTKSKRFSRKTKSITSNFSNENNHNNISDNKDENNNRKQNNSKNLQESKEIDSSTNLFENGPQPIKRKVTSKFYRSYTFNFAEKPDITSKEVKNRFAPPSKQNSNNNLSIYSNNNINNFNVINNNNSNNFGLFRRSSFFNTSTDLNHNNNDLSPSLYGSQNDCLLSEENLMLKQPAKGTYEAFINKYDHKKDKIIPYFIMLNSKMMLYFKNDCKSRFRGLHYLSDTYAKVTYDKTQSIMSNGIKYFYINMNIKGSMKWFVSKTEFEMRKWFEVLKKTINPHKSRQLKDYYLIKETLCEGKYGVVKRCLNKKTKQEVSIKIINIKSLGSDPKKSELIYKEIEILRHCNHRSVLKYIDHFIENNPEQDKSYIHIVMEYLCNGDLANYVNKNGALHESRLISMSWDIAKGLEYLHKLGIIHRDIKPENIVFDAMQKPRIVDFGLSQIVGHEEYLTEPYGTYFYASPEIHNKTKYNKATDIWSFGMLMFYVLTGEYPFERNGKNKDQAHFIISDLEHEFELERNINFVNASRPLKDLISRCLRKRIEDRNTIDEIVQHEVFKKFNGFSRKI